MTPAPDYLTTGLQKVQSGHKQCRPPQSMSKCAPSGTTEPLGSNPPPWFESQRMRLNDPPHRWLVEIRHNADPPVAEAGSAIFFHIQRGPDRTSAGCTVMPQGSLLSLIRWLRADRHPQYVRLPKATYLQHWKSWGLPSPQEAADLL